VSFADLHLWFAWFLPGFCLMAVDEGTELAAESRSWFPFAAVRGAAFAYLAVRPALDGKGVEFGARAYGRDGELAAAAMVEQIQAWHHHGRTTEPSFAYWPTGADRRRPFHRPGGCRRDGEDPRRPHDVLAHHRVAAASRPGQAAR
jgi:protein-L-isoaspartate(D-aspartate) O-methyltransferase